ncbi:hypothetical protein GCM10025857_37010 [Alicyclobacillus contaminans]|uniref:LysM peptidoglycan-binding domain-containing protein n=1 Tax=Alicyclobacillus contaminans TaxID=392016 RepID=UPI00047BCA35|nr:LysM peptidoglycan-binding domain-containing protein [Alicyclobacillus contaminans]GMA52344.1 hypothetical protein GCM10025857_37010 [Alicyclobacillus contaminans]
MTQSEKAPLIQLSVDQEIFMDTVWEGDTLEDATVATEVTSFDRVGDAYVLEGAIVFAGYLTRPAKGASSPGEDTLSVNASGDQYAKHIHHRMPFTLRVPVKAQARGIVNVTSRIAEWQVDVVGSGWIRLAAELTVSGLNGSQGYHFQCGAQENGNLFFSPDWNHSYDAVDRAPDEVVTAAASDVEQSTSDPHPHSEAAEFAWTRGPTADEKADDEESRPRQEPLDAEVRAKADELSLARGGHGLPEADADQPSEPPAPTGEEAAEVAREELRALDQAIDGPDEGDGETRKPSSSPVSPTVEYEFEHQLNAEELAVEPSAQPVHPSPWSVAGQFRADEAELSLDEAPTVRVGSDLGPATAWDEETSSVRSEQAKALEEHVTEQDASTVDKDLWSFVDFNGPEAFYTLRFAIVMEEETLESVVERLGCSKSDLQRVNRLTDDRVYPGQPLRIPNTTAVFNR